MVRKVLSGWLPVGGYCLLIYFQSAYPSPGGVPDFPGADKIMHFVAYAVLGALFLRAFRTTGQTDAAWLPVALASIGLSSLYGLSDELHQYFVPARHADCRDFAADVLGSLCGVWIYWRRAARRCCPSTSRQGGPQIPD